MGNNTTNLTYDTRKQHLSGFSLVEVVLSITILGICVVVVAMVLAQMMQVFASGSREAIETDRLRAPMMQVLREFSAAEPTSVQLGSGAAPVLRFEQVAYAGAIDDVDGMRFRSASMKDQPSFVGMRIRFAGSAQGAVQVTSVNGAWVTVSESITGFPERFQVLDAVWEYTFDDGVVVSKQSQYQPGADTVRSGDLCSGVERFTVEKIGTAQYRFVLESSADADGTRFREERTWALY